MLIVNDINKNIAMIAMFVYDGKTYTDCTQDIMANYPDVLPRIEDSSLIVSYTVKNLFDLFADLHDWEKSTGSFAHEEKVSGYENVLYYGMLSNINHFYMTRLPEYQKQIPIDGDIVKIRMKKWIPCASEKWARQFIDIEKYVVVVKASNNGTYYVRDPKGRYFHITADNIICKARDRRTRKIMRDLRSSKTFTSLQFEKEVRA